jgi:hypothetical protein
VASGANVLASGASGGTITLLANGGSDSVTGSVLASGTMGLGGTVDILGQSVALGSSAVADASGSTGGGQLVVGGLAKSTTLLQSSATSVAAGALLSADATSLGDGGHVVVFGLNTMDMDGSISAKGGVSGGNGGLIETSGEVISIGDGAIAANARAAGGKAGTWLLDPGAINITNGGSAYSAGQTASTIDPTSIATVLDNGTNVTISTSNVSPLTPGNGESDSITVSSAIVATSVKDNAVLALSAGGDIFINAGITGLSGGSPLTLNLNADTEGAGGNISVAAPLYLPGGAINASGAGFTNAVGNTITALNITAVIDAGTAPTATGFQNLGVIDASGASNGSVDGGSVTVNSSETVAAVVSGTILADAYPGSGGAGGTISITSAGAINVSGATLSANGGAGAFGGDNPGGDGGSIALMTGGVLTVSGATSMSVAGGDGASINLAGTAGNGGYGGQILLSGGSISVTGAVLDAHGGAGGTITNPTGYSLAGSGGFGGNITAVGSTGAVTLIDTTANAAGGASLGGGGDGGSITISGASIAIGTTTDPTMILAQGGAGGAGAAGSDANGTANATYGTNGGNGGNGGAVLIETTSNNDGSGTVGLTGVTLNANAGAGGIGGAYNGTGSTLQNTAGYGGDGGYAGSISVEAYGAITLTNSTLTAVGGAGGDGGSLPGIDPLAGAGNGGDGGQGGSIGVFSYAGSGNNEADITLTGTMLTIAGGNGGNGGVAENSLGSGGSGGNGGNSTLLNGTGSLAGVGIAITGIGVITIDGTSSLNSVGGNGGNGQNAQGLNITGYNVVGPGNGGNGGTAGAIYLESSLVPEVADTATINNAGTISILGGSGGNGGGLLSGMITNNGGSLAGGTGGVGGDAGVYEGYNGSLTIIADDGALTNTGTINVLGGSGGNGGLSNDQVFGPGNGGNGGNAAYVYTEASNGDANFGGTVNMGGGNGGNGGDVTDISNNNGGASGNGGNTDGFEIDANGTGYSVLLSGSINYNAGVNGNPGSDAVRGHYGNYGFFGNASDIYLYSEDGDVIQQSGNITGVTGSVNVNASAFGNVQLTGANNAINSISGIAQNGEFQVTSNQGLTAENISAEGEIDLAAPYLYVYDGTNITSQNSVNLTSTSGYLYINGSVQGSNVSLTSNGLLTLDADSIVQAGNFGEMTLNVGQLNVSAGAQLLALNGSGTLIVTSYGDAGTIYLSGDSYSAIGPAANSELVLGSEFFNAINFSAIQIGDGGTSAITAQSFSGAAGTISIAAGDSLNLTAATIGNDSLTTIQTDLLNVVSNSANLSGLSSTSGGPLTLAGSALSASNATLSVTMAPGGSILVGDVNSGYNAGTIDGLEVYNSVTLLGTSVHLNDYIYNTGAGSSVTLGSNNPASVLAIGGTGYAWDLSQSDVNQIYSDNITIGAAGQSGQIVVAGPVSVPTYTNVSAVTLSTTGGGISLVAGSLDVGAASLTLVDSGGGSITDVGNVAISGGSISLYAAGAIGSAGAPIVLRTPGAFGATASGGGVYIDSQGSLYTESQGISATGDVVVSATGLDNYGSIYGDQVTIDVSGFFGSSGVVHGGSGIDITAGTINTLASSVIAANGPVNLTGSSALDLEGIVFSNNGVNLTGGNITLSSDVGYQTLITGTNITITGSSLNVLGATGSSGTSPTSATYSTGVLASGTLDVTISGNMTVVGGDTTNGSAALVSGGDSVYQIGGNLNMSGGTANGAFALLDPTNGGQPATPGTTMTITANQVNLTGGSVPNAYAAIVATGNVVFNAAQQVTLTQGSQSNADAVVISKTGTITANTPDCVNCTPETGTNPLLNTDTNQGFYGGLATAPPPAAPPPAPPPAPAPVATGGTNGLGDPANDTLIQDLITLLDIPLDAQTNPPIDGLIFVDGGVDGCF